MPRPGGSTTRWRRTRALVLARDGYRCRAAEARALTYRARETWPWSRSIVVSPDCTGGDRSLLHVHHVRGQDTGDDPAYLLTLCRACNLATGRPQRRDPEPRAVTRW